MEAGTADRLVKLRFIRRSCRSFLLFLVRADDCPNGPAAAGAPAGVELGHAGLSAAAARRLCLCALARALHAANAGDDPPDAARRDHAADRAGCQQSLPRRQYLPLGAMAAAGLDRSVLRRVRPGPARPTLVRNPWGGDPYPLYAASNLGSFGGLLTYPLVVEPLLPVATQSVAWSLGYGLVLALVASCVLILPKTVAAHEASTRTPPPALREVIKWMALAAIPSGLILSTTLYYDDIVAMPLMWVVPLGLYLLSFTVAFASDRRPATWITPCAICIAAAVGLFLPATMWLAGVTAAIVSLFAVSVALHGALFDRRPDPAHLTGFYLFLSVGGVIGGILGALVAPIISTGPMSIRF